MGLKILHVEGGSRLYGGALQVLYLLRGLTERGVENRLACRRGSEFAVMAEGFATLERLPMHGDLDLLLVPRLYRLIRRHSPDLVHLHSRIGADLMGGLAGRLAGVPVVHTRRVDNPELRWLAAAKYRLHDRVIAISAGIREVLREAGVPQEKLRLVRSAVDSDAYAQPCDRPSVLAAFGLPAETLLVGVVAQLIPRKGHLVLLRALPPLIAEFPELRVVFFGRGAAEGRIREQIHALGLHPRVHLAGFRDDLPAILPCLDLLVHPAMMEGLGVSLLQAAAAGVPIVATKVGGIPEAVEDGVGGCLVPPGDVGALAAAMRGVLADPYLRRAYGEAGRARVRADFSVDAMVEGNLAVYRELLQEARLGLAE